LYNFRSERPNISTNRQIDKKERLKGKDETSTKERKKINIQLKSDNQLLKLKRYQNKQLKKLKTK
jgi:hypothetical protein